MPTSSPLYNALTWPVYCIPVLAEQTLDLQEISKRMINNCPQESSGDLNHTYKSFHQFDSINHYFLEGKAIKHVEALSIIKWIFPITRKLNATLTLSWNLIPSISINQFLLRADFNHYLWQFRVFNIWSGNVHSTNQFPQENILVFWC